MNFIVCLVIAAALSGRTSADISWSHEHLPTAFGGSRYAFPSFDAYAAHNKAKYLAKKAHDLAKLRSSIYGVGHGLYGFRYGSSFPTELSKPFPLLPFATKYPVFDLGLHQYPSSYTSNQFFQPDSLSSISGHLTGFGYPKSYRNAFSKSYSYGKGFSYGNKHSYGINKPYNYEYSNMRSSPQLLSKYIKKIPGEEVVYESEPQSHGYQYSYIKESPDYSEINSPHNSGGYDSIYGIRYNGHGSGYNHIPVQTIPYVAELPVNSGHHSVIPSSEIILTDVNHGDTYIPVHVDGYEKFAEVIPDIDGHSLNVQDGHLNKFDGGDLIAYGSKRLETKQKQGA